MAGRHPFAELREKMSKKARSRAGAIAKQKFMTDRFTLRKVRAKELGPALRRRFHLVADEEVSITVTRKNATKIRQEKDPWIDIRGTLSAEEADEMLRAIHASRRSKNDAPQLDAP